MNDEEKFFKLFGGIFFSVGVLCTFIGLVAMVIFRSFLGGIIPFGIGVIFALIGGGILLNLIKASNERKKIKKYGKKFTGKIYGYVDDKSGTMNGDFLVNTKVHFFDEDGIEREAILPTKFTRGSGDFPVGASIDIIKYNAKYTWVPGSVKFTHIEGEEELMDDKPVSPDKIQTVAITCPNCGASYTAAKGYAAKCPYCGSAINA